MHEREHNANELYEVIYERSDKKDIIATGEDENIVSRML